VDLFIQTHLSGH